MLVAALYDSTGKPRVNAGVSIRPVPPPGGSIFPALAFVRNAAAPYFGWSEIGAGLSTDSSGVVRAEVRLGYVAGEIALVLEADPPIGSVVDTVKFEARPGLPTRIDLQPMDSALYEGGSYSLRARVFDGYDNERDDEVTTATDSAAVTVSTHGVVEAKRIGRALVRGTVGEVVDSAWVSVVPHGVLLVAGSLPGSQSAQLLELETDGSHLTVLHTGRTEQANYSSSGARIAFVDRSENRYSNGGRIFIRERDGTEHPLLSDYVDYQEKQEAPRFTVDEQWVYYAGGISLPSIMRVHPDGTGLELVAGPPGDEWGTRGGNYEPEPSPDGRYVAYRPFMPCCNMPGLRILDLEKEDSVVGPRARHMRWIPGTDSLVISTFDGPDFFSEGFTILRPDGTVVRSIAAPMYGDSPPFDISPDGRWVAAITNDGGGLAGAVQLISLDTGIRLRLGFTTGMGSVAWHPSTARKN
jgi:hypothetical protein